MSWAPPRLVGRAEAEPAFYLQKIEPTLLGVRRTKRVT